MYEPGYGGLFSVVFESLAAAQGFYDALDCAKGPSLGTNFTLACPYAIIAHYSELEWAEKHGIPLRFVRVSVGLEDRDGLLEMFANAVKAAENAHTKYAPGSTPQATWRRECQTPADIIGTSADWD